MERLKWIDSAGGPLVLVTDKNYKLWSGILKRNSYLDNKLEDADDFMDADEADYGKACLVEDYLGVVDIGSDVALVLGDEPLSTTVFLSVDKKVVIARWYYGENEEIVDNILQTIELNLIDSWEFSLIFNLSSDKLYLFDAASYASMLDKDEGYLYLNIKQGQYKIWTSIYEPDDKTKLLLHKFEMTN